MVERVRNVLIQIGGGVLLLNGWVDGIQLLGVVLMPDIHEEGARNHKPALQLALQVEVKAVIVGLLEVLRIPEQILSSDTDVRPQSLAVDRAEVGEQRI